MTLDWAHLADRQGAPLESLVARWLVRKYPDAQQVTPANHGDGGIDIYRSTPEGLVVWQVKGFTAALKPGQWQQIKDSWDRFVHEHVDTGEQIASYSLVTPWTPSMKRQREYAELTESRDFPCYWNGTHGSRRSTRSSPRSQSDGFTERLHWTTTHCEGTPRVVAANGAAR
jgi:hypothetical protein